jgi:hypothetical protein
MQKKILFAVDGSDRCLDALTAVGKLLKDHSDCDLELFHAVQESSQKDLLSSGEPCKQDPSQG